MTTDPSPPRHAHAGKYLTFTLGREAYGVQVLKVREILRAPDVTPVPQMPPHVKGVINLRGNIIPVVDLRIRLAIPEVENTDTTCTVVVQVQTHSGGRGLMGLIVDSVEEVTQISGADIEAAPDFGAVVDTGHILGMAKVKGAVKTLLDIDRLLISESPERLQHTPLPR